jgi:hypothetical protein
MRMMTNKNIKLTIMKTITTILGLNKVIMKLLTTMILKM